MRPFPRTAQRRMAAALVAVMALGMSAAHADDLKDRQREVERQIKGAHQDLDESSAQLRKAAARLAAAHEQLSVAKTRLATARGKVEVAQERDAEMQAELAQAEADLAEAEAELARGQADRADQRERVANTVADMYSEGDPDLIAFSAMLDAVSTEELTRRDGVRDVIVGQEARAYDQLKAAEVLLEVQEDQVSEARDEVADQREAAAEHLELMQALETEQQDAKDSVVALVVERRDARVDAREARAKDLAKLRKHLKQQDRIEEMLRKRAARALARARARPGRRPGRLPAVRRPACWPCPSTATSPRPSATARTRSTTTGACTTASTSAAAAAPRCARPRPAGSSRRYWSGVYGNRLVVDHGVLGGKGVATIYNHASGYTVGVGDQVAEGQVLGYEGDTGWSTGCHLHFTVMANGQAVDPMNWF